VQAIAEKKKPATLQRTPHQLQVLAKALLESGMSLNTVARQTHLSVPTVIAIKRMTPSNITEIETCKKTVVGSFYGLARGCQENITLEKLEDSSAYQLMGMASLAVQAARDMEGLNRPVFNVVDIALNIEKLIGEAETRRNALITTLEQSNKPSDLI
jgi:hypothetical protein